MSTDIMGYGIIIMVLGRPVVVTILAVIAMCKGVDEIYIEAGRWFKIRIIRQGDWKNRRMSGEQNFSSPMARCADEDAKTIRRVG